MSGWCFYGAINEYEEQTKPLRVHIRATEGASGCLLRRHLVCLEIDAILELTRMLNVIVVDSTLSYLSIPRTAEVILYKLDARIASDSIEKLVV